MGALRISTDRTELDLGMIHRFLSTQAYWSRGVEREQVGNAIAHSLCFGGYLEDQQVAFARMITDYTGFAYLADVFVLPEHRGRGHGIALIEAVMAHPVARKVRKFMLTTSDAQGLYAKFGFAELSNPRIIMERLRAQPEPVAVSGAV
ncbi:MAG: GNAT family N-acetyltransferase [Xanthomonadaceae bacterium]|jgi:GNAT superfamily N-acetyltransferase|nr:GNAT family N-acetyltransferase [Xanthomonadaceae bacterium]